MYHINTKYFILHVTIQRNPSRFLYFCIFFVNMDIDIIFLSNLLPRMKNDIILKVKTKFMKPKRSHEPTFIIDMVGNSKIL